MRFNAACRLTPSGSRLKDGVEAIPRATVLGFSNIQVMFLYSWFMLKVFGYTGYHTSKKLRG